MDYESSVTPHPSYQLEDSSSDSELEQDQVEQLCAEPKVSLQGDTGRIKKGGQVVFLIGEAGERLAQGVEVNGDEQLIKVIIDGQQVSSVLLPLCVQRP